jgi:hypothetical protein
MYEMPDVTLERASQDAVARNAKFWLLYKRPGQRVVINDRGDIFVRPSYAELSMQQSPCFTSLSQARPLTLAKRKLTWRKMGATQSEVKAYLAA